MDGLTFVNEINVFHVADVTGQFIVLNDTFSLGYSNFTYDPDVVSNPPSGLKYFSGGQDSVTLVSVREVFDAVP